MTAAADNPESCVNIKPLVNGVSLQKYSGRHVTLIGVVILVNPQGTSFDVKTPDLQIVTVSMRKPLTEAVSGLVQVEGIVQGRNAIICDCYTVFPKEMADTYDQDLTNEVIQIIQNIGNPWSQDA